MYMLKSMLVSKVCVSLLSGLSSETLEREGISMIATSSPLFGSFTLKIVSSMDSFGWLKN
jgi:hypothetical protein